MNRQFRPDGKNTPSWGALTAQIVVLAVTLGLGFSFIRPLFNRENDVIGIRGDVNDSSRNEYGQEVGMVEQSKINTYGILKACRHNIVEIYHGREDKQKPWRDRGVSRLQSFFNDEHGSYEELKSNLDTNVWDFWQPHMQQLQEAGKINVLELREAPDSKDFNGQIHTLEVDFGQERAIIEAVRGRGV